MQTLGRHLAPADGFTARSVEVSAVHISELIDPTAYLAGGELLLTTGMSLPSTEIGCRRYVARLIEVRVSALAIGLGPVHQEPPAPLIQACRNADLTLLIVPAPTPFLTISRAYWEARSKSTEQQLNDAVAAHRALVDAAVAPDPGAAILRRLARALDGWAARLTESGELDQVYPLAMGDEVAALQAEIARLDVAGVHSSASFSIADHVVVVYPLAVEDTIVGYLAAGTPGQLDASRRRVVLTAAALLSLDAVRGQRAQSASEATRRCIALLIEAGMIDAARRLASQTGDPGPRSEAVIMAARARDSEDLIESVVAWCPDALPVAVNRSTAWLVLPDDHAELKDLVARLAARDSTASAVLSDLVPIEHAGAVKTRLLRRVASLRPGQIELPHGATPSEVSSAVDAFLREATVDVRDSLIAYLRHRGQWEPASRELGQHRNTVRYRVARGRELLGLDLDDPDVAAQTWLTLRERGSA